MGCGSMNDVFFFRVSLSLLLPTKTDSPIGISLARAAASSPMRALRSIAADVSKRATGAASLNDRTPPSISSSNGPGLQRGLGAPSNSNRDRTRPSWRMAAGSSGGAAGSYRARFVATNADHGNRTVVQSPATVGTNAWYTASGTSTWSAVLTLSLNVWPSPLTRRARPAAPVKSRARPGRVRAPQKPPPV